MGLFDRLFKKRSSSQPLDKKQPKNLAKNASLPNLNKTDPNLKSLGQVTEQVESDEEQTNVSPSLRARNQSINESNASRTKPDYESSSESSGKSRNDLDFLNTLTGTNKTHDSDSKSITSVSSHSNVPIKSSLKKETSNKSLADRIKENSSKKNDSNTQNSVEVLFKTNSSTNQSVTFREPESQVLKLNDKAEKIKKSEHFELKNRIEILEKQLLERDEIIKKNADDMIIKFHENESRNKSDSEKQELIRVLVSKQQESNEKLINDQKKIIDLLNIKCRNFEKEIKNLNRSQIDDVLHGQVDYLEEENLKLKELIRRQNTELNYYYSNYGKKKEEVELKLSEEKNKWKKSVSQLTPLFLIYDQKLQEKDEAMKLMRLKIDEITNKFNLLIEENQNLHSKLQNLPENIKNQLVQIKSQAELVLEENKFLSEKLNLEEKKVYDSEKFKLEEISRLSKRILNCEVERMELLNKIDMLEANNEEIVKKFNESSVEMQRRIKLDDHLTQIGDLKRKMEELNLNHKHEAELLLLKVQAYEDEKKKFIIKLTDSEAEIKRLKAENMVLDEALNKGIGHRAQKRLKDLNRSLEMGKINESKSKKRIEHLEKELEKIKFEKKILENLVETSEADFRVKEKRIEELIAKNAQIEEAFNEFKDKASLKLANLMEKLKRKDSEIVNLRVENEKKIAKILKLSEKKHRSIGDSKESKDNEVLMDSKFLKQVLQELRS